jgi:hypothetical protein
MGFVEGFGLPSMYQLLGRYARDRDRSQGIVVVLTSGYIGIVIGEF